MTFRTSSDLGLLWTLIICGLIGCDAPPSPGECDACPSCDDASIDAEQPCLGCQIGSLCYPNGITHPTDPCRICDRSRAGDDWSPNDGAPCDDGLFCTTDDVCDETECRGSPRDCDDGIECNGEERCDEAEGRCLAGESTCGPDALCDPAIDGCVTTCAGCVIDGVCYGQGQVAPGDPCRVCDGGTDRAGWTDNDGAPCDDGVFCNGVETCDEERDRCSSPGSPCGDDGLFCNGFEICDEEARSCVSTGSPCSEGDLCVEEGDRCCRPLPYIGCDEAGDVVLSDGCGDVVALIEDCPDLEHGGCALGRCGCAPGWGGEDCDRCVRYVNGATGNDSYDGTSWERAKASVQVGITAASGGRCEVWVAAGTYLAGLGRDNSIILRVGVDLIGGFAGWENRLDQRNVEENETILSGDIGEAGDPTDNTIHVVFGADETVLDGFTITGGYADCGGSIDYPCNGGGYYGGFWGTSIVRNCTFIDNYAENVGGAAYNGSVDIDGCLFIDNTSAGDGGALSYYAGAPWIRNSLFIGNHAARGGALAFPTSSGRVRVSNVVIFGNTASERGGGVDSPFSGPSLTNAIVWGNEAPSGPQISGRIAVRYCDVEDPSFAGRQGNLSEDPRFVNADPEAGPLDLRIGEGSPCIDAGDDRSAPELDRDGAPRADDPDVPNCAEAGRPECDWITDIGAYERQLP